MQNFFIFFDFTIDIAIFIAIIMPGTNDKVFPINRRLAIRIQP
jgi:hypothetical protein